MTTGVAEKKKTSPIAGMGQIVLGQAPIKINAILGSCIGVAIYHARSRTGAFAHVVLPDSTGRNGQPGKFADTAIPFMVQLLANEGITISSNLLVAKIAGGANMFGIKGGTIQVGENNADAVRKALEVANIRLAGEHVGGKKGRRTTFDCQTGELTVEIVGAPPVTL